MDNYGEWCLEFSNGISRTDYFYGIEWSAGYGPRFGIVHVDFETLERTVKNSSYYLKDTFERRRIPL
jgi:beta-glucosidase/6-phospho-beta-glucosidase/beta-galactosidase